MTAARPPMQDTHDRYRLAQDAALAAIACAELLRHRSPADVEADRADARTEAAYRRTQQRREERLERKP